MRKGCFRAIIVNYTQAVMWFRPVPRTVSAVAECATSRVSPRELFLAGRVKCQVMPAVLPDSQLVIIALRNGRGCQWYLTYGLSIETNTPCSSSSDVSRSMPGMLVAGGNTLCLSA